MMLKNKPHIIFSAIAAFIIYSCSSLKDKDILGRYNLEAKISKGSLILNENNVFEYSYEAPMETYTSKGKWHLDKKSIILKSDDFYLSDFMDVKETFSENRIIKILDESNIPIEGVTIKINDINNLFVTDKSGIVSLRNDMKIDKIIVEYIGLSNRLYEVKNFNAKAFEIRIIPKDYTKMFFDNYHGKINNKEIKIYTQKYIKDK
ncbi:hypothetical protein ABH942_003338 [Flavobacterium sp. 28YEA47A]|uniref:hypothetical protein n=1 Tax=Flavobacterium sp. 28YEA47A TaxID=3156276 RepID=UPI00351710B6